MSPLFGVGDATGLQVVAGDISGSEAFFEVLPIFCMTDVIKMKSEAVVTHKQRSFLCMEQGSQLLLIPLCEFVNVDCRSIVIQTADLPV